MMIGPTLFDLIDPSKDQEATAIIDRTGTAPRNVSYGELRDRIAAVRTRLLREHGLAPSERVIIIGANSVDFLASYFGIMSAGGVAVPVNGSFERDIIRQIIEDSSASLVLTDRGLREKVETSQTLNLRELTEMNEPISPVEDPVDVDPSSVGLILCTSGSTGTPKGVMLSHDSQLSSLRAQEQILQMIEGRTTIVAAPLFHMNALTFVHLMLAAHGKIALHRRFDPVEFANSIDEDEVMIVGGVPPMIARLAQHRRDVEGEPFAGVFMVLVGSAPLTDKIIADVKEFFPYAMLSNGYGTTEIGPGVFREHPEGVPRPPQSIGYPSAQFRVRLVDGPSEDEGVLEVSGPGLMSGYQNQTELTEQKLKDGWYRTGDMFRRDENGFFYFTGREDDMFVCNGENIYPQEIEKVLEQHPLISGAAVVPKDDATRGQIPIAFVVATASLTEQDVQDHFTENAAPYKYPRRVFFLDELPVNDVSKVDKRLLAERAEIEA